MPYTRKLPDDDTLKRLLREEGWTWVRLCETYDVSKQALHKRLKRAGLIETAAVRYDEYIPWKVAIEHATQMQVRMLRLAARRATGSELSEYDTSRLERWLHRLAEQDAVVGYTREPHPVTGERGFYYTARRPGVDLWLIREPEDRVRSRQDA